MAMTAGSITSVALAGGTLSYAGSGLAREIAEAMAPAILAAFDATYPLLAEEQREPFIGSMAAFIVLPVANSIASAVVAHIAANAHAHVTTQQLGRTPNPNTADTQIQAPLLNVDIPIV